MTTALTTDLIRIPESLSLGVRIAGEGPAVVLVPSLGRGAIDFDDLAGRLGAAGFRAIAVDPRGVGSSSGSFEGMTLHDLARDLAALLSAMGLVDQVFAIGHAFGNRVVRTFASDFPESVQGVCLIGCGGQVEADPEAAAALQVCLETGRPDAERLVALATAMFAPGNDPLVWLDGWWPGAARAQRAAIQATDPASWRAGGSAPMLIVQGLNDRIAKPENGHILKRELGDRVTLVDLDQAGHALLPEQPEVIAEAIIPWLTARM
jgi:pimeloyl-ACP methyl ester carboxylesterase